MCCAAIVRSGPDADIVRQRYAHAEKLRNTVRPGDFRAGDEEFMNARLLFIALLVASPVAWAKHPRDLTPIQDGAAYVLAEDFVATEKAATFTLKAGTYVSAFEDGKAFYLLGEANCLEMHVVPPKQPEHAYTMPFNCGIYYPKAEAEQALFFAIRGALPYNDEMGPIINAIIQAGEGSFNYPISRKSVVGLRPRLRAVAP